MIKKCVYGGGDACVRQGGDGTLDHGVDYVHPYSTVLDFGEPLGEFTEKSYSGVELDHDCEFPIDFDEDVAIDTLNLEIHKSVDLADLFKSLYDFDINTPEGITQIMELLPIMDPIIVVELVEKLWPGYTVEDADPELLRAECRGFLLDYLDGEYDTEEGLEPTILDSAEGDEDEGAADEAPADEAGTEPDGAEGDDEGPDSPEEDQPTD